MSATTTNQTKPTAAELAAGVAIIRAVADTVKESGRAPRGILLAAIGAAGGRAADYARIESLLVDAGLVRIELNQLVWIG